MKKDMKESFISVPWGKLCFLTSGDPSNEPVFVVHGRQDSAATFFPLLDLLPDHYYYVLVDLPGNGRSDPFPIGIKVIRFHFIAAIEAIVNHFGWEQFIYLSHSLGGELGMYYNAAHPGRMKLCIYLDSGLSIYVMTMVDLPHFFKYYYIDYYENYHKHNFSKKLYKKQEALEAVMKARRLTEDQAELVLSRNLTAVGPDTYKLSWDLRLKRVAHPNAPIDLFYDLFSKHTPPSLLIEATDTEYMRTQNTSKELIRRLQGIPNFSVVKVEGDHDVHLKRPQMVAEHVNKFLNENRAKSKL